MFGYNLKEAEKTTEEIENCYLGRRAYKDKDGWHIWEGDTIDIKKIKKLQKKLKKILRENKN